MNSKIGDKLVLNFGIPPTNAQFTIEEINGKLIAVCSNAEPKYNNIETLIKMGAEPVDNFDDIPAFRCLTRIGEL